MHLSRAVVKSAVAKQTILEFKPQKIELKTPEQAMYYLEKKKEKGSDFRMSDVIKVQTGVQKIETHLSEEDIEKRVLSRLKEVQESAFQEAYQLGLDEGRKEAFQQAALDIESRLKKMDTLLTAITNLKMELIQQNESHLVQLAFHMASRIAHAEVKADPAVITQVIKDALQMAQIEEEVIVHVSPLQIEFLETLKAEGKREFEFLKKVKMEPSDSVSEGGCVIQTNYGEIDARFEERVNKLWAAISESLYRVKDKVSAA